MLTSLVAVFFGCRHRRTTFPLTLSPEGRATSQSTHVTCLDCGKEFAYDWATMRIVWTPRGPEQSAGAVRLPGLLAPAVREAWVKPMRRGARGSVET